MAPTPGRTTQTGTQPVGAPHASTLAAPPIELPAAADQLAGGAAVVLGWNGTVLPRTKIFGRSVNLVARLRTDVHAERIALGAEPVTDRATVATWTWDEFADTAPGPGAEIIGVFAVARHWRTAMAAAVPFSRYHDTALVLPESGTFTQDYVDNGLPRARDYGLAVVTADPQARVDLDLNGRTERLAGTEDPNARWINELAYAQLLEHAQDSVDAD